MDLTNFIRDTGTQILALSVGLFFYKRLNLFAKLLLLQVGISLVNFGLAKVISHYDGDSNNQITYSFYVLIESLIVFFAAYVYEPRLRNRKFFGLGLFLILASYLIQFLISGFHKLPIYAFLTSSIFISAIHLYVLYEVVTNKEDHAFAKAIIVLNLGVIVSFVCMAPYMAVFNYLNANDIKISIQLYNWVLLSCSNFRYLSYLIGFILFGVLSNRQNSVRTV